MTLQEIVEQTRSEINWDSVIMNINDMIESNLKEQDGYGLQVGREWITPEGCYNLWELLKIKRGTCLVSDKVLESLRKGTNYPDDLKY